MEDAGRRRLGSVRQGRVEARREKGRAHVDFARGGLEREIPLEPQMLKRHADRADDRENNADGGRRGKPVFARSRASPGRKLRRRETKSGAAAPPSDPSVRAIFRACRVRTRHRRGQTSLQTYVRATAAPPEISTIRIPVRIFVQTLDRAKDEICRNGGEGRAGDAWAERPGPRAAYGITDRLIPNSGLHRLPQTPGYNVANVGRQGGLRGDPVQHRFGLPSPQLFQ